MAFSTNLLLIDTAISQISVSGVTMKSISQLAASWAGTPRIFFPNIDDGWITDLSLDYKSLLRGSTAPVDVSYTLNYRYLGVQVGGPEVFPVTINSCVNDVIALINALQAVHAPYNGKVDMQIENITNLHPLPDLAGNMSYGCDFALHVEEQQN